MQEGCHVLQQAQGIERTGKKKGREEDDKYTAVVFLVEAEGS